MNADASQKDVLPADTDRSLWDVLLEYVPEERVAAYFRVAAHLRTFSPDDELIRVIDAMGLLALITCETPGRIAVEGSRLQEALDASLCRADAISQGMRQYLIGVESRLTKLPAQVQASLNAGQIANLLAESVRQAFAASKLPEVARAWNAIAMDMERAQKVINARLLEISDPVNGSIPQLSAKMNEYGAGINKSVDAVRGDLKRFWLPLIAAACFVLGIGVGVPVGNIIPRAFGDSGARQSVHIAPTNNAEQLSVKTKNGHKNHEME